MKQKTKLLFFLFVIINFLYPQDVLASSNYASDVIQLPLDTKSYNTIDANEEKQCYSFTTSSHKSFYEINVKNVSIEDYFFVYLLTDKGEELWKAVYLSKNDIQSEEFDLEPNTTYYFQCNAFSVGNFSIEIREKQDDILDTKEESKLISAGTDYNYSIDAVKDQDWFQINTNNEDEYYTIRIKNLSIDGGFHIYLYNIYEEEIWKQQYLYKNTEGTKNIKLSANSAYYIKCAATNTGMYHFDLQKTVLPIKQIQLNKTNIILKRKALFQLENSIFPKEATDKQVKWKSSNTKIATVNAEGVVRAKQKGQVTISCIAVNNSDISADCKIAVR